MNQHFAEYVEQLPALTEALVSGEPLSPVTLRAANVPGVYSFSENGQTLYIGRTKNFRNRYRNHTSSASGENTAAFAFLLAREASGKLPPSYRKEGGRRDLMTNSAFREKFDAAKRRIQGMEARFIPVADGPLQLLLELYASLELGSRFNKFLNT